MDGRRHRERLEFFAARLGSAFPLRQGVVNELGPPELSDLQLIANFPSSGKCPGHPLGHGRVPGPRSKHYLIGGETTDIDHYAARCGGPSPRGRGNPRRDRYRDPYPGTIPARAGKPLSSMRRCRGTRDHPRAGGETSASPSHCKRPTGPSPRGRGNPPMILVALAGNGTMETSSP